MKSFKSTVLSLAALLLFSTLNIFCKDEELRVNDTGIVNNTQQRLLNASNLVKPIRDSNFDWGKIKKIIINDDSVVFIVTIHTTALLTSEAEKQFIQGFLSTGIKCEAIPGTKADFQLTINVPPTSLGL